MSGYAPDVQARALFVLLLHEPIPRLEQASVLRSMLVKMAMRYPIPLFQQIPYELV